MRRLETLPCDLCLSKPSSPVSALAIVATLLLSAPGIASGADVMLTDVQGNRVEVRGVQLSYDTRSTGLYVMRNGIGRPEYVPVWQDRGLKLYQGDGQVLVDWTRIQRIVIRKIAESGRIPAEIVLRGDRSAEQVPVELVKPGEQLIGTTLLGRFSIDLTSVASIEPLITSQAKTESQDMRLTGISLTDRKGVTIALKVPDGFETPWLSFGAGSLTIRFDRIANVDIKAPDSAGPNLTMGLDIDGQGRMQFSFRPTADLQAESNLGTYSISWNQIASIVTRREKVAKK